MNYFYIVPPQDTDDEKHDMVYTYGDSGDASAPKMRVFDTSGRNLIEINPSEKCVGAPSSGEEQTEYPNFSSPITLVCYENLNDFYTIPVSEETYDCLIDALVWLNPITPGYYGSYYDGGAEDGAVYKGGANGVSSSDAVQEPYYGYQNVTDFSNVTYADLVAVD